MLALQTVTDSRGVTRVILNRPDRHNALDRALIDTLRRTLDSLSSNTHVLVLEARGKSFCAGGDLDWMRASVDLSDEANTADALALSDMLQALDTFRCPTIARVHGAAIGGGAGLVACCDIAIAGEDASFAFSEVRLGLIPATISPYVLNAIGHRATRRYFATAERFDALEAYRLGLVHDVCSTSSLDHRVREQIELLLKGGVAAQRASKTLIADTAGREIDDVLRLGLAQRLADIRAGKEAQEGLTAFIEKRPPRW